jgi:hypothetical protein
MTENTQIALFDDEAFSEFDALTIKVKLTGGQEFSISELAERRTGFIAPGVRVRLEVVGFISECTVPVTEKDGVYDYDAGQLKIKVERIESISTSGRLVETPEAKKEKARALAAQALLDKAIEEMKTVGQKLTPRTRVDGFLGEVAAEDDEVDVPLLVGLERAPQPGDCPHCGAPKGEDHDPLCLKMQPKE